MPIVNGKKYPYTDAGKKAAYDAASNFSQPITDVMNEPDGGPMIQPEIDNEQMIQPLQNPFKSKLKPYKLNRGI